MPSRRSSRSSRSSHRARERPSAGAWKWRNAGWVQWQDGAGESSEMSDAPPPVGFNLWLAPTKPNHSVTNIRCWGKFWSQYKAKDKTARIFQCASDRPLAASCLWTRTLWLGALWSRFDSQILRSRPRRVLRQGL